MILRIPVYQNISGMIKKDQVTKYIASINESIYVVDVIHQLPSINDDNVPGFELILVIYALVLVILLRKKKCY